MDNKENTELNFCYNCMTRLEPGQTVCPACGYDNTLRQNPEDALPEGTILMGKYMVGKVLGQGGFGITYLGFDTALKICVAIKEYYPSGIGIRVPHSIRVMPMSSKTKAENFRKGCDEFQLEAERLAQMDSPNIVKVRDYFRENGTAYIVMNYLDGNSLTKEAAECGGRIPWQRAVELFKPLILEIEKLHKEQLIHRDIKPDNIKVVREKDGTEHLVLLDFGNARSFVSAEVTGTFTAMLTPGYAPIEQYSRKSRQGPYTDIYALCAAMYAVITGTVPATAADRMTGEAEIQTFGEMGIDIPAHVERAIFHGLEVRGADRPQSMRDLYDELNGKEPERRAGSAVPVEKPVPETRKEEKPAAEEKPEPKKKGNRLLPVLLVLMVITIGAGIFLWRGMQPGQLNTAEPRTAQETQEALSAEQTGTAWNLTAAAEYRQTQTQAAAEASATQAELNSLTEQTVQVETKGAMETAAAIQSEGTATAWFMTQEAELHQTQTAAVDQTRTAAVQQTQTAAVHQTRTAAVHRTQTAAVQPTPTATRSAEGTGTEWQWVYQEQQNTADPRMSRETQTAIAKQTGTAWSLTSTMEYRQTLTQTAVQQTETAALQQTQTQTAVQQTETEAVQQTQTAAAQQTPTATMQPTPTATVQPTATQSAEENRTEAAPVETQDAVGSTDNTHGYYCIFGSGLCIGDDGKTYPKDSPSGVCPDELPDLDIIWINPYEFEKEIDNCLAASGIIQNDGISLSASRDTADYQDICRIMVDYYCNKNGRKCTEYKRALGLTE